MAKKPPRQIALAQHFLRSPKLVQRLLASSSITSMDSVYEIGAGRGIITAELARLACRVIAIEKDPLLANGLHTRFQDTGNVQIVKADFLHFRIPDQEYKIFANIPFNRTADIVRRILYAHPIPAEAYLILQKEAAEKFSGSPRETQFSILAKAMFDLRIVCELRRTDFIPAPGVDSVFLHVRRRCPPQIHEKEFPLYRHFVHFGFGSWRKNLKLAFKPVFTYKQWKHLSRDYHFPLDATPTELTFEQWLGLFACFKARVPEEKQAYLVQSQEHDHLY